MTIRINKIYTRQGDAGETRLIGGNKVKKSASRVEAYGLIEHLNSFIGLVRVLSEKNENPDVKLLSQMMLKRIQNELFDIGSILATFVEYEGMPSISENDIGAMEAEIDFFTKDVPELTSFVLPGADELNAHIHTARTTCRNVERFLVGIRDKNTFPDLILVYFNRLSDWLFGYSRWVLFLNNGEEFLWRKNN